MKQPSEIMNLGILIVLFSSWATVLLAHLVAPIWLFTLTLASSILACASPLVSTYSVLYVGVGHGMSFLLAYDVLQQQREIFMNQVRPTASPFQLTLLLQVMLIQLRTAEVASVKVNADLMSQKVCQTGIHNVPETEILSCPGKSRV